MPPTMRGNPIHRTGDRHSSALAGTDTVITASRLTPASFIASIAPRVRHLSQTSATQSLSPPRVPASSCARRPPSCERQAADRFAPPAVLALIERDETFLTSELRTYCGQKNRRSPTGPLNGGRSGWPFDTLGLRLRPGIWAGT